MNAPVTNHLNNSNTDESNFHRLADNLFDTLLTILEKADENGTLEVEYAGGVMTINLPSGQQYIVNKHTASKQIWLSSPKSGGLHFSYDDGWKLSDGRELAGILFAELEAETGETFT